MSRRLSKRRPVTGLEASGLGALTPRGKQVALGVTAGVIASTIIYFTFFFAPEITKGKTDPGTSEE